MRKKILAGLLAALCLCSCENSLKNQSSVQSDGISSEVSQTNSVVISSESTEKQSSSLVIDSAVSESDILWGDYNDTLKRFDDHDGRKNNYKDYIMTTRVETDGRMTQEVSLLNTVGSEFLTELQDMNPAKEHLIPPEGEPKVILTITEAGVPYQYIFYKGGNIYTVQNKKTYYLQNSTSEFDWQLNRFEVAALTNLTEKQAKIPKLPKFDPWNYQISSDMEGGASKHKTDFMADKYDVVVIETDYANLYTTVLISDTAAKAKILDYLNKTNQNEKIDTLTGGAGPIIRVFNKTECFNYLLRAKQIIDYQNELVYAAPDGLYDCIEMSVTNELVRIFEEK